MGREVFGGGFSRGYFVLSNFAGIPMRHYFYLSYFLFADSISNTNNVKCNFPGDIFTGLELSRGSSRGGRDFQREKFSIEEFSEEGIIHKGDFQEKVTMEGAQSLARFKKQSENKVLFSNECTSKNFSGGIFCKKILTGNLQRE